MNFDIFVFVYHCKIAPDGTVVPSKTAQRKDMNFVLEFSPRVAGRHLVHVQLNGQEIKGSPYIMNVFNVQVVKLKSMQGGFIGQPTRLEGQYFIRTFFFLSYLI